MAFFITSGIVAILVMCNSFVAMFCSPKRSEQMTKQSYLLLMLAVFLWIVGLISLL